MRSASARRISASATAESWPSFSSSAVARSASASSIGEGPRRWIGVEQHSRPDDDRFPLDAPVAQDASRRDRLGQDGGTAGGVDLAEDGAEHRKQRHAFGTARGHQLDGALEQICGSSQIGAIERVPRGGCEQS